MRSAPASGTGERSGLGLRTRIFLATMAVIAGLLGLTYAVMGSLVDRILEEEIEDGLGRARNAHASFRDVRHAALLEQARSVGQVPHLRAVLDTPDVDESTLRYTVESLGEALGTPLLFVADARGSILADTRAAPPPESSHPSLARGLTGEESCQVWDYGGEDYLIAVSPVALDGAMLGLVGLGLPLAQHARDLQRATGLDVTLLRGARVIAAAWSDEPGSAAPPPEEDSAAWAGAGVQRNTRVSCGGREYMVTAVPLAEPELLLVLSSPLDDVLRHYQRARTELLLVGLTIAGLGLLVSRWISERIARPIRALTTAANELARGELAVGVDVRSRDEVGVLARAFNDMARQLSALMRKAMDEARAAEQASRAKSVFLATMSHEVRTPLHGVLGFAEELRSTELTAQQRECLGSIERSGQDLLAIIEEILDFARLEAGQARLEESEFRLSSCLARALDPLRPAIAAKGLAVSLEIDAEVPDVLVGPASRLRQVVASYAGNALKFTARGGLTLRASLVSEDAEGVLLRVSVTDTGIGIAPADVGRLFRPFAQLDSGADREYGGTGLGLAICKELAALMQGEVGVESAPGVGSTFWFTARLRRPRAETPEMPRAALPAPRSAHGTAADASGASGVPGESPCAWPPAEDERRRRAKQRVLVAEDNRVNQRVLASVLERAGWRHALAENGEQAVALFAAGGFDLVLMDCQMPLLDGLEATRRIRALEGGRHVPILALTANAFESDRDACLAAGMDDFVAKPFTAAHLVARLDRWLEARSAA